MSAEHGEGLSGLYDALRTALPEATAESETDEPVRRKRKAHSHRRRRTSEYRQIDADQSACSGEERLLTGPEAGTTRDAIAVDLEWRGRRFPHL